MMPTPFTAAPINASALSIFNLPPVSTPCRSTPAKSRVCGRPALTNCRHSRCARPSGATGLSGTVQTSSALGSLTGGAVADHLGIASTMHFGGLLAVPRLLVFMTFGTRHASLKDALDK